MVTRPSEQARRGSGRTDNGRASRVALDVPVRLRGGTALFTGMAKNLGPGGIFVATVRLLAVGEKVTVGLDARGDAQPVEALAEVRWCRPFVELDDLPAGGGLRFVDTPLRAAVLSNELRRARL